MVIFDSILTEGQMGLARRLFPHCSPFYLAGGTALALQIGHRRSLDFDLATGDAFSPFAIERNLIKQGFTIDRVLTATGDEFSVVIEGIRVTFFFFPFAVDHPILWHPVNITLPDVPSLAAMKAYALGRRSKWKDYVDLYFILKYHLPIQMLITRTREIFANHFNAKLFREQLCYFADIDYSEAVEFISVFPAREEVEQFLTEVATQI